MWTMDIQENYIMVSLGVLRRRVRRSSRGALLVRILRVSRTDFQRLHACRT